MDDIKITIKWNGNTISLQRSYDSNHGDFYQTEAKIAFEDGSALYGAAHSPSPFRSWPATSGTRVDLALFSG